VNNEKKPNAGVKKLELRLEVDKEFHIEELHRLGFSRIADRIELLWEEAELNDYFTSLIIDQRGDRSGFPEAVFSDILSLYILHNAEDNEFKLDPWILTHLK
jgi:hypothetical protein